MSPAGEGAAARNATLALLPACLGKLPSRDWWNQAAQKWLPEGGIHRLATFQTFPKRKATEESHRREPHSMEGRRQQDQGDSLLSTRLDW